MAWYYIVLIGVGVLLTAYLVFVIRQTLRGHLVSWDNTFRGFLQAVHYVFDYYLQTHKTQGIKAGRFYLKRSQSTPQIVEKLQQKPTAATNPAE